MSTANPGIVDDCLITIKYISVELCQAINNPSCFFCLVGIKMIRGYEDGFSDKAFEEGIK